MKKAFKKGLNSFGYNLHKINKAEVWPADFEDIHKSIIKKVRPFTMTSPERLYGLIEATKYILAQKIEGAFVECGVWKGGSMLATAETLIHKLDKSRELFLYDTFEGMPPPTEEDKSIDGSKAENLLNQNLDKEKNLVWAYSTLEQVKSTMALSAYPASHIHFIKGKVEDTIPATLPDKIALLRLDTDWYESTKHELIHLFPKLERGGVLIIDDYGHWKGARKAVDEYFQNNNIHILLNRMDETGRIAIKQ